MAIRERIELREVNGTTYLVKYSEVDRHEGYTSYSFYFLREASEQDIEEHRFKKGK